MKVFEILDDDDQYPLMVKLLQKAGFTVGSTFIRGKEAISLPFGKPFGLKSGRVILKNGTWHFDVINGQGHKLHKGSGNEQDVLDFFSSWVTSNIKEEILSKRERIAMMNKLLSSSGFYSKDDDFGWVNVYHLGQYTARVVPHGQSWEVIGAIPGYDTTWNTSERRKRCKDEAAVVAYLNSLKELPAVSWVKEDQTDLPLVWELAMQQRAKGKRVSIDATVIWARVEGRDDITRHLVGEIMLIDPAKNNVSIYADRQHYGIKMYSDDDERLTLVKDSMSDFYWVQNHEAH
jgi:hypothetical protein